VPGNWSLAFDSEFNGSSLDNGWSTGWFGSGITGDVTSSADDCFDPNEVGLANGELDFWLIAKSEWCGGAWRDYATGMITTAGKFTFTYGFAEARIWMPGSPSLGGCTDWPSFWLDGTGAWPDTGEIDTLECLWGNPCWHFHSDGPTVPGGCDYDTMTGGWHTYGVDWEPGSLTFYYDGGWIGSVNSWVTGSPMFLILDLGLGGGWGGAIQAPAEMRTDYVRVWQH
jgi:beta-glucanase (GH16 family)